MNTAPAPLYLDPIYGGPTDPTLIYNRGEHAWWMIYTQRRANVPCHKVTWVHGTDLGVASSRDGGRTWLYRGTLYMEPTEPGRNTWWAPEVLWADGIYHMFVSYITGVPDAWVGDRRIMHYTSTDLWHWKFESALPLPGNRAIDACIYTKADGWRLWYKDESDQSHTHYADSPDLYSWTHMGVATGDQGEEGPNVFRLGGKYWMIADIWDGQAVYSSADLTNWTRRGKIMSGAGTRTDDTNRAHHADVVTVDDGRAFIFYFTHPGQGAYGFTEEDYVCRRSCVQTALLTVDGDMLRVTRDEPFEYGLPLEIK